MSDMLARAEYARLLGIEDLARLLISGWDNGYPLNDDTRSEGELIERFRAFLPSEDDPSTSPEPTEEPS